MFLKDVEVKANELLGVFGWDVAELFKHKLDDFERQEFLDNVEAEDIIRGLLNIYTRDELIGMVKTLDDDNKLENESKEV
ncbi:hypothetical protein [Campylobacter sp. MIT 97-5078]|uniref:hypothetical protein n=1 Tax=Campylobacter sp. MIT 97-5078 TaxID=1548153 RepID=UPI00051434AD|nr:hypothetical protein [Campylobacter sp. MIT 97-5078]KGI55111.1 hypothetical protein LR59_13285 [Campylobacter sp. MIT 97-5078]KGI56826.1 hypothetical protein LR59_04925 [Campylobacter sp. MIT 97-5078]TQR25604.1 hypothetical protein DMB91_07315 [Campylobacter sp. MIT 97-5078]